MDSEGTTQTKVSWPRRLARIALGLTVVVAAFGILGGYVAPKVLRDQLQTRLTTALQRPVTVDEVRINPFTLEATVTGLRVAARTDHAGEPDLLSIGSAYVNFNIASLWRMAPIIDRVTIERPELSLVRYALQSYNVSDLVEAWLADQSPAAPFSVSNIRLVDGRVTFDDRPLAQKHAVTDLAIGIPFVSDLPPDVKIDVTPQVAGKVDGHSLALAGDARPFDDPPAATLKVDLDDLPLRGYLAYVPVALPVVLQSGRLTSRITIAFVNRGKAAPEVVVSGTLALADLAVAQHDGRPVVRAQAVRADIARLDLAGRNAQIKSIAVDAPMLEVVRGKDGTFALASLFAAEAKGKGKESAPFRFRIAALDVTRGGAAIVDEAVTPAYRTTLADIAFSATELTNGAEPAKVKLAFATNAGERLTHEGTLVLSPFALDGALAIAAVDLKRLYPYYSAALNLEVGEGKASAGAAVHVGSENGDLALRLSDLHADVSALSLRLPGESEPLWRFASLALSGGNVDTQRRLLQLGDVTLHAPVGNIRRNPAGEFNYARMFKVAEGGATKGEDWRVATKKLALDNGTLTLRDDAVKPQVRVALNRIRATMEGLGNTRNAKARISVKAAFDRRGTIAANGTLTLLPFATTLSVTLDDAGLPPLQPYITDVARVVVTGGTASVKGTVDVADGKSLTARFRGDVALADVTILDEVNNADLLRWKSLRLAGVDAASEPLAVTVADVVLSNYYARLVLDANGEFNLQQLARDRPDAAPVRTASTPGRASAQLPASGKEATTWLKVAHTELVDGAVYFSDFFVRPNYSVQLTDLSGKASTLVFDTPAEIALKGRIEGAAPVEIAGRINPLAADLMLDLTAKARDVDLPPLTPYSGKYAGYGIQKGKLSAEVTYKIENRKLAAQNRIILDQLTFGDRVESPQATKLPVRLAVALLKDRHGVIDINLPIGGSLDDPQFSVGGIVIQAILNLIVKIVTAPFTLLASIGGHGEELAFVGFPAGTATLDAAAQGKLAALGKALNERPNLSMDVAGRVDPETDAAAMRRLAVERKVRQQKFNDLVKDGTPPASLDAVVVAPTEYDALLARVYRAEPVPGKPTNAFGQPKEVPKAEMEAGLLALQQVDAEALRTLANRRAQSAKDSLVEQGVAPERIFVVAPRLDGKPGEKDAKDAGPATRVDFALK